MSSVYEYLQDIGIRCKPKRAMKRYGRHIFRKKGKMLLDEAPTKYWGHNGWYY